MIELSQLHSYVFHIAINANCIIYIKILFIKVLLRLFINNKKIAVLKHIYEL